VDTRDAAGSDEIKPLVNSLQEFYQDLFDFNGEDLKSEVPVVKSDTVRAEFFKLFYDRNNFALHE
jgi:hypothetical protein